MSRENRWKYMKTDAILSKPSMSFWHSWQVLKAIKLVWYISDRHKSAWLWSSLQAHWAMGCVRATAAGGSNFDTRGFAHLYTMRMLWWYSWGVQSVANLTHKWEIEYLFFLLIGCARSSNFTWPERGGQKSDTSIHFESLVKSDCEVLLGNGDDHQSPHCSMSNLIWNESYIHFYSTLD